MGPGKCPVCRGTHCSAWAKRQGYQLYCCHSCHLVFQAVEQPDAAIHDIYDAGYYRPWLIDRFDQSVWDMKVRTCREYLSLIDKATGNGRREKRRLLDIGCAHGFMLEAASQAGYYVSGVEVSPAAAIAQERGYAVFQGTVEDSDFEPNTFDTITLIDVLEHLPRPGQTLEKAKSLLKPGGVLFVVTPDIRSITARLLKGLWPHYLREHYCYYSAPSLRALFQPAGMDILLIRSGFKFLTTNYILGHLRTSPGGPIATGLWRLSRLLPEKVTNTPWKYPTEMMAVACRRH
jgi:2-polyprenyl-3-methyl-5-hydroxy-6-metoxy-1,4-benzoquinol methylase